MELDKLYVIASEQAANTLDELDEKRNKNYELTVELLEYKKFHGV